MEDPAHELTLPRYGTGALPDLLPSVLAGLGVPGEPAAVPLPPAPRVCVLLVDGLGARLLAEHAAHAPFLGSLADAGPVTAGFPSTTATSIASIGAGVTPGEHGIVGYTFAVAADQLLGPLDWRAHGTRRRADLRERFAPEDIQPHRTAFERAADAGVAVRIVAPREQEDSGLSRAALRGGRFRGVHAAGDLAATALGALGEAERVLCYAYHADLDLLGHVYGPGSAAWCHQLSHVDLLAATIADGLPPGALLVVTGDHGMVGVAEPDRVDVDTEPELLRGVRMVGGEGRARHVYTEPSAVDDVRRRWADRLGERVWIARREEAIAAGWFGPVVAAPVAERIGDLVVAARGDTLLVRSRAEPVLAGLPGQHGSLSAAEQLVPVLTAAA